MGGGASICFEKSKQMLFLIGDLEVNDLILTGDALFLRALCFSKELMDLKVRQEIHCKCLRKRTIGVETTILQINLLARCSFQKTNLSILLLICFKRGSPHVIILPPSHDITGPDLQSERLLTASNRHLFEDLRAEFSFCEILYKLRVLFGMKTENSTGFGMHFLSSLS